MATASDITEQEDRLLAELAERSMDVVRNLQGRILAAENAEAAALSGAFHRIARGVRQTLALRSKLARDNKREAFEDRVQAVRAKNARVERRKAQVKLGVERCVWSEAEAEEAERLLDDLDDILEMDVLADAFATDDPLETHIARICEQLGVTPPTLANIAGASSSLSGGGVSMADGGDSTPGLANPWRSSG